MKDTSRDSQTGPTLIPKPVMRPQGLVINQLVDMEWKFGVTASSSERNKAGNTFLQMKLVINKGNTIENVYMELTLPQFYSFLHEMEKARSTLEYLT
ncbi:PREDICTED: COMM domain-containing protein 7-like [Priapulus caudatus]|uniref:COMM domain-containing protein 7-like n=1 Tax=Priapulus caudatus TaxID=37621 RepID=A0ABM1EFX4_PRICU|nr:PREDICTED: COMM domain-containing protein 7-like [Priapulus caudatus]